MATATVILPVETGCLADGTANNAFPEVSLRTSTDADNPKARIWIASFGPGTDEYVSWQFRLPTDYSSGGTLKMQFYMSTATSGSVVWGACVQAVTPGDSDDMYSLDPVNEGGGWAYDTEVVPGTIRYLDEASITLNMDSAAAGDYILIEMFRNGTDSSDDAVGDANLVAASLEYTT